MTPRFCWEGLAAIVLLSGCNSIVLDRAKLDGDLALTPPAVVPDSARAGSWHGQLGLRVSHGPLSEDTTNAWSEEPVGGYLQVQRVFSSRLRGVLGAGGYPGSVSAWGGPVFSVRNQYLRWDMETLLGWTWMSSDLQGHVDFLEEDSRPPALLHESGSGWRGWGQFAIRARSVHSGPWVELKFIPMIQVGTLVDTTSSPEPADDRNQEQSAGSLGVGWIQEFSRGQMLTAGVRFVAVDGATTSDPQFVFSWQLPLVR